MSTERMDPVRDRMVGLLYQQLPIGLAATVFNASILVAALYAVHPPLWLWAWFLAVLLVSAARYLLALRYRHTSEFTTSASWERRFLLGSTASAILWAVVATLFFPTEDPARQMLVLIIVAGMTAGALPLLSPQYRVFVLFMMPLLLALFVRLLMVQQLMYVYVALLVLAFMFMLLVTGHRYHNTLLESLSLRLRNEGLEADIQAVGHRLASTESELENNRNFISRIMENSTNAVYVIDPGGKFSMLSAKAEEITGYPVSELVGEPFTRVLRDQDRASVMQLFQRNLQGEIHSGIQLPLIRKDGESRVIMFSTAPLWNKDGVYAVVGTAQDITRQHALERVRDEFVSSVSHELRTPLTAIQGALSLLGNQTGGELSGAASELVDIAARNSTRLLTLIDRLLDIQRIETAAMKFTITVVGVAEVTGAAVERVKQQAAAQTVRIENRAGTSLLNVRADRSCLEDVLTELLSNAIKYGHAGGVVELEARGTESGVCIEVLDRGPGVPEKMMPNLFEKLARMDMEDGDYRGGSGIGLALSQGLMKGMGGSLGYQSREGGGAAFVITVPRSAATR